MFTPITAPDRVDWSAVERIVLVPFLPDGSVVLVEDGVVLRFPAGGLRAGEHPIVHAPLRIGLEVAGFRRQGTHPFGVADGGRAVALWVDGSRYTGEQPHADARWWTGAAVAAASTLRDRGPAELAALVELADRARRSLTDEQYWADSRRVLDPAYLEAATPEGGSGFGGSAEEWFAARGVLCDALDHNGSFLDSCCANGHLMASIVQWSAARGVHIEPYGVDISDVLAARARSRLPQWADRIWTGNALTWVPPDGRQFDYVHALFDCVPEARYRDLVQHQLDVVVAPGGRVIMSNYGVDADRRAAALLERLGFRVAGETRPSLRSDGRRGEPSAWLDAPG